MIESVPRENYQNHEQWFVDYCQKVRNSTVEIHKILSNNEYIDWLCHFSEEVTSLADTNTDDYSDDDVKHINNLQYLYGAIRLYADKAYLVPDEVDGSYVYYLRYNDIVWIIGQTIGEVKTYFYTRVGSVAEEKVIIDFKDMQDEKKLIHSDSIKVGLAELAKHIELLLENGVPEEEIRKVTEDAIKLKFKKEE